MRDLGNIDGGVINLGATGPMPTGMRRISDSTAIASGKAFLMSELEKIDVKVRQPLTSFTYARDIPVVVGGGWVDTTSGSFVNYGIMGGSGSGSTIANGSNEVPVIQLDETKERWGVHTYSTLTRIGFIDLHRAKLTGRNLEEQYSKGVRLNYDKHLDQNVYLGFEDKGTYGIINSPNCPTQLVVNGVSGSSKWNSKTPDEILADINQAIIYVWNKAENDLSALPNHIIIPYEQYSHIATTKVSEHADKTILTFLEENNIASKYGGNLFIGATGYCKGAGTGGTDRMAVYVHDKDYIKMEELVPLQSERTMPNIEKLSYDTWFVANISQVEMFYEQETIGYFDGI